MLLKLWFDGTVYLGELACRLAGNYACVILVGVLEAPPPYSHRRGLDHSRSVGDGVN